MEKIFWKNNPPRIFLIVVAPREARKVAMKAFCKNVTFWNSLVGSRLGNPGSKLDRKSISEEKIVVE